MAQKSRPQNRTASTDLLPPSGNEHRDDAIQTLNQQFESSHRTLQELVGQVADIHAMLRGHEDIGLSRAGNALAGEGYADESLWRQQTAEIERLRDQVVDLKATIEDLEKQNSDLAAQLGSRCVKASIASGHSHGSETLTWEERKSLMLRQMEEESFDLEAFAEGINAPVTDEPIDPVQFVEQLQTELDRRDEELRDRSQQIHELQYLLEQQSETRAGGIAIGAAAITQMFDADELVREERVRLQQLQEEWEDKFRQAEIEASLERAKLSRERQELSKKMSELEEQLSHAKQNARQASSEQEGPSRRWLVKLGLADGNP